MKFPFGKHKGTALRDIPTDYLEWVCENIELRDPLKSAIAAEMERRTYCQEQREIVNVQVVDELVSAGLRVLSKTHHPDAGGSHERMVAINAAADWLRQQARLLA